MRLSAIKVQPSQRRYSKKCIILLIPFKSKKKLLSLAFADRDPPAADIHDPKQPVDRVRAGGHRGAGQGARPRLHAEEGQEEERTAQRPPAPDLQ